ncbi:MAG: CHASE3 domain-containing protein [Opitutaceae bacterium]|nr:CHASE3 domain-containing protein [Opitutaceae bacterium]
MKDTTLRRILLFFLFVLIVLVAIAVISVRTIGRSTATNDWVNHTHAVIDRLDQALNAQLRAHATLRAYAATGEEADLNTFNDASSDLTGSLELAGALTRREPETSSRLGEITTLVEKSMQAMREIIAAKQAGDEAGVRAQLIAFTTNATGNEIQRHLVQLRETQLGILSERDSAAYLQAQSTRWIVWTGVAVNFLLLAGAGWLIRDDLAARRRAATALAEANTQLEIKVQERTAELTAANEKLSLENIERQWANQALEHQLHYNRSIVDSISDLVLVLTKTGAITRVNTATLRLTGGTTADLIKQSFSQVIRFPAGTQGDPVLTAMKEGRDLRDQPAVITSRRGDLAGVLSLYPLRDQNKVIGGIITLQITESPSAGRA